jgi:hypothetical protein
MATGIYLLTTVFVGYVIYEVLGDQIKELLNKFKK